MDSYIARQPIYDRKHQIFGYELLFRNGLANYFDCRDVNRAARQMIRDSTILFGIETLTGGKKAFVNLTRESLVRGFAGLLPADLAVLEILESVEADERVLRACRDLKQRGYTLALDDFVYRDSLNPLMDIADLIKVDFLITTGSERRVLFERLASRGKICLAEKLETEADFREAFHIGYHLFQGFFFSKPVVLSKRTGPGNQRNLVRFLQAIHEPDLDHTHLSHTLQGDLNLCYKLLRHLQASGSRLGEILSIEQALATMDEMEVIQWATRASLASLAEDKPMVLITRAAMRGRLCESLAVRSGRTTAAANFFLMGLFSVVDAMFDCDLEKGLNGLPLDDHVRNALLQRAESPYRTAYEIVLACERRDTMAAADWGRRLDLEPSVISRCYLDSIAWANRIHG